MTGKGFDRALRKITHGVYVISTRCGDKINAMTAAWVSRISFKPPLVMVAVGNVRYSNDLIKEGGVFAINILGSKEISLGKHFGFTTGKETNKFASIPYEVKVTGSPILKDAVAYLDCRLYASHEGGDHTLFLGEVLDAEVLKDEDPLVYHSEDFFSQMRATDFMKRRKGSIKVYTDGCCRGNPGSGAIGILIMDNDGNILDQHKEPIGICTNNVAEYRAIKMGLDLAAKHTHHNVEVFSDSKLVVHQMKGDWRIKEPHLQGLFDEVKQREARFDQVVYNHVPRTNQYIQQVDRMANEAINGR